MHNLNTPMNQSEAVCMKAQLISPCPHIVSSRQLLAALDEARLALAETLSENRFAMVPTEGRRLTQLPRRNRAYRPR
jgi:hypothetical protein